MGFVMYFVLLLVNVEPALDHKNKYRALNRLAALICIFMLFVNLFIYLLE